MSYKQLLFEQKTLSFILIAESLLQKYLETKVDQCMEASLISE